MTYKMGHKRIEMVVWANSKDDETTRLGTTLAACIRYVLSREILML